jgi:hypothetical protein
MMNKTQTLIPKQPFTDSEMHDLVDFHSWFLSAKIDRDPDNYVPFTLIWTTLDRETTIHYVEDELVKFPYIVIKGKDVQKVASEICSEAEIYSSEELVKMFVDANTQNEKMKAVAHLGVASPQDFDPKFFELLQAAFSDPDPEVRRTAVWCIGYSSWREFRPILEQLVASDPVESIREQAGYMLESYKQHGIG